MVMQRKKWYEKRICFKKTYFECNRYAKRDRKLICLISIEISFKTALMSEGSRRKFHTVPAMEKSMNHA